MKLRNKKTGEILESVRSSMVLKDEFRIYDELTERYYTYSSLAELNAEWEDYEEPKEYWHIAELCGGLQKKQDTDNGEDRFNKQIGNYFETEEEAEKAVEKLKAWKRLKDKGLKFERWCIGGEYGNTITFSDYIEYNEETRADLDLLFGGEE